MSSGHTLLLCAVNPYLVVLQTFFSTEYALEHVCQILLWFCTLLFKLPG